VIHGIFSRIFALIIWLCIVQDGVAPVFLLPPTVDGIGATTVFPTILIDVKEQTARDPLHSLHHQARIPGITKETEP